MQEDQLKSGMLPTVDGYGIEPATEWGILNIDNNNETVRETVPTPPSNYEEFFKLVHKHLRENGPVPVDPNDALKGIKIIENAYKSNTNKIVIAIQ
ncbi:putative oxidoreductase YvaA [compost metagenome]